MKITYNKNPLSTTVELDEQEKKDFRAKLVLKELEDHFYGAYFTATHHDWLNKLKTDKGEQPLTFEERLAQVAKELDPDYWMDPEDGTKTKLEERVDMLLEHYLEELQFQHLGDCTAFAASCSKCHAESILGIHTTAGLGKHAGYAIQSAFSRWNPSTKQHDGPDVSLDQAIGKLNGVARDWLVNYRETHFKD